MCCIEPELLCRHIFWSHQRLLSREKKDSLRVAEQMFSVDVYHLKKALLRKMESPRINTFSVWTVFKEIRDVDFLTIFTVNKLISYKGVFLKSDNRKQTPFNIWAHHKFLLILYRSSTSSLFMLPEFILFICHFVSAVSLFENSSGERVHTSLYQRPLLQLYECNLKQHTK